MLKMEIQTQGETYALSSLLLQNTNHYLHYNNCSPQANPYKTSSLRGKDLPVEHHLSQQEVKNLKTKQEKNILQKIEKIVRNVDPIHEAENESQNENNMDDLIEEFDRMDLE